MGTNYLRQSFPIIIADAEKSASDAIAGESVTAETAANAADLTVAIWQAASVTQTQDGGV